MRLTRHFPVQGEPCAHTENLVLIRRTLCSHDNTKRIFLVLQTKLTTISFAPKAKVAHTKKPQPLRNLENNPRCEQHGKLTKMRVVKDFMKANYGRLLFACSSWPLVMTLLLPIPNFLMTSSCILIILDLLPTVSTCDTKRNGLCGKKFAQSCISCDNAK